MCYAYVELGRRGTLGKLIADPSQIGTVVLFLVRFLSNFPPDFTSSTPPSTCKGCAQFVLDCALARARTLTVTDSSTSVRVRVKDRLKARF